MTQDTQDIWQQPLGEFLEATASDAPTPGGGSVVMVGGALGLGLVLMALNVTARGKDAPDVSELTARGEALLAEIKETPRADMEAFGALMAAYRMPKASEEEKSARRMAIDSATIEATEAPLEAAALCVRGLELAASAAASAKPSILSDVEAGALLLRSAGEAVLLNVDINLPALGGEAQRSHFQAQRGELAGRLSTLGAAVADALKARAA
ncbi:MAG: cyclodeaminase/cyclohydrolase family protein [Alphaproteobacteria bacterium]